MKSAVSKSINMLLLFCLGDTRYALPCDGIKEICPLVEIEKTTHTPDYIAGIIRYRGRAIPVADLRVFFHGQACRTYFSTRIIVMEFKKNKGSTSVAGFIAEKVTETKYHHDSHFLTVKPESSANHCIHSILMENKQAVHLIDAGQLYEHLDWG